MCVFIYIYLFIYLNLFIYFCFYVYLFAHTVTIRKPTYQLSAHHFWGSPVVLHLAPLCRGSLAPRPAGPRRRARLPAQWNRAAAGAVAVPPRQHAAGGGTAESGRNGGNGGRGEEEGDFLGDFWADGWKMMSYGFCCNFDQLGRLPS